MKIGKNVILILLTLTILGASLFTTNAGAVVLTNNSGDASVEWFVSGEASLVMNGFNLTNVGVALPAAIDRVSIAVTRAVPGQLVDIVVYQDANGGSPADAVLAGRAQADITTAGVFTYTFPTPIVVTQPVVWVGFYLPVDFRFSGDQSGTSVLTYWAWSNAARFDVASLSSAQVLGPADGTAPVNINMGGVARITAEITSTNPEQTAVVVNGQTIGTTLITGLIPPMTPYEYCSPVLVDTEDMSITLGEGVDFYCSVAFEGFAPASPAGYERRGFFFEIFAFGNVVGTKLPDEVTHCIRPAPEDLATAVIGVAYGAPREWQIRPSQRYGDVVCAELPEVGFLSYFVPAAAPAPTAVPAT